MFEYDLHIHSNYSFDCDMTLEKILSTAKKRGLKGISITDHNTFEGCLKAMELNKDDDFIIIPGIEVTTNYGDILVYFLTYLPFEEFKLAKPISSEGTENSERKDTQREEGVLEIFDAGKLLKYVKMQNGISILAHPSLNLFSLTNDIIQNLNGVEIYNWRHPLPQEWLSSATPDNIPRFSLQDFANKYKMIKLGCSDAHNYSDIGKCRTIIPASELLEVKFALLNLLSIPKSS